MEEPHEKYDPMDIEQPEHPSLPSTAYGSPSYSPPELDLNTKEEGGKAKALLPQDNDDHHHGEEEEDEEEEEAAAEEEEREARRKAKGKGRAHVAIEDDDNDDQERPSRPHRARRPKPLTLHPTAVEDNSMEKHLYLTGYGHKMHFGDADAAMNETLSSPSSPSSENNETEPYTTPVTRAPLSERRNHATLDIPSMFEKLNALQQQQASAGWGRGGGRGWGLEWKETMTQEKVEQEGWSVYEDRHPSPAKEEMGWEVYDPSAWERAAEKAKEQEAGEMTMKLAPVKRGQGSKNRAINIKRVTNKSLTRHSGDIVRAVRGYKAILPGNYLSYERDDLMKVIHRDRDGKLFILLPLKDFTWSGRAHMKNFIPADTTDLKIPTNKAGSAKAETKRG